SHRPSLSFICTPPALPPPSTLSLHDALPISWLPSIRVPPRARESGYPTRPSTSSTASRENDRAAPKDRTIAATRRHKRRMNWIRSEEHTSELQSLAYLVCRLLLEKKKKNTYE